jgi:sulfate adenylyltransferase subunit 2
MTVSTTAQPGVGQYELSHLRLLEAEAIHIIREVAAEFERPVLLFSGGKDSIVMLHLAIKAFRPGRLPFPVMHVDTGHNFEEVIATRDQLVADHGLRLVVASVQEDIDAGRVVEGGPSRNPLQTVTLLRGIAENRFDAAFGGARRDEEKARAKERVFSFRDEFGQWDPKAQRPELWNLYNGRHRKGEHIRVFPLSNWTEYDIWAYIGERTSPCRPSTTRTAGRCSNATGCCWRSTSSCSPATTRRSSRRWCGSAPSETSPAPGAWSRPR